MRTARMWSLFALIPLALTSLAVAPPDDAECRLIRGADTEDDPSDDVEVCEVETYFHRSVSPVGNLGATDADELPSWDAQEPTGSVPSAYAQYLGSFLGQGAHKWPTFEGEFTGDLDTMQVTVFLTSELYQHLLGTYPLIFELQIDGETLLLYSPDAGSEKDVPMTAVSDGMSRMDFAVTGIYEALEAWNLELGPDVTHTVSLSMSALYFGDGNSVYWYDSVDQPSGIHFNADVSESFITRYDVMAGG